MRNVFRVFAVTRRDEFQSSPESETGHMKRTSCI